MVSSACRSFGPVGLIFPVSGDCHLSWRRRQVRQIGAGARLVARRRQIWRSSPATAADCVRSGSRSAWRTSSADTPHRQAPVLQVWSSAHNAYKAMALAWILVCWCSASSLSVRLGDAGSQRQFQIWLFAGTPIDLFVIFFYVGFFLRSFLDICHVLVFLVVSACMCANVLCFIDY